MDRLIAASADFVLSVTEVALSVTAELAGMDGGGVKVVGFEEDADPQEGAHAVPDCARLQATPAFVESFATVAVNCKAELSGISALAGETETTIAGTVTLALPVAPL